MENPALKRQIEAAFDYRGHVTLTLTDGRRVEGFLFNRDLGHSLPPEPPFVEMLLKGSGERTKIPVADLRSVELTGEDHAAGKSHQEWVEKQAAASREGGS